MLEILVATVVGLVLVVGPLAWRVERDRRESRALATRAYVQSLMHPVHERGKIAQWVRPPTKGINSQPFDFEYVRR